MRSLGVMLAVLALTVGAASMQASADADETLGPFQNLLPTT